MHPLLVNFIHVGWYFNWSRILMNPNHANTDLIGREVRSSMEQVWEMGVSPAILLMPAMTFTTKGKSRDRR